MDGVVLIAAAMERSVRAPITVSDELLEFYAEQYLADPWLRAHGLTFERFLNMVVRNGALFEKLRHRAHPRGYRRRIEAKP